MRTQASAPRTIAIASGKGGVGKSFLALNLAWSLAELGQRVLLLELDADAGALSIAAGLGEPKARAPALDAQALAQRVHAVPGAARIQLLRAADIPAQAARSPAALEPLLASLPTQWRIVDLGPGLSAQNVLWMRRAAPSILIGTPELVCVRAMLRLHLQLQRQQAYERLCAIEPRLRTAPASLSTAKQRLIEWSGAALAEEQWRAAFQGRRSSWWIFNRVLADDDAQLARIRNYLRAQAGSDAALPRAIPEEPAQLPCARYGRPLMAADPSCPAAQAVRNLANELLASQDAATPFVRARREVA